MAGRWQPRIVRTLANGRVTIPRELREALGIVPGAWLEVDLAGDRLEIRVLPEQADATRRYSSADISRFLAEDTLDADTARRVRQLLETPPN